MTDQLTPAALSGLRRCPHERDDRGLDTMKSTIDRVVTTLVGRDDPPRRAHLILDPVTSQVSIDPLVASSDLRITLPPVVAVSDSTVDLKPVVVDSSVRVVLGDLPPTEVRAPYEQTWSWSLFGKELFSLTVRGETTTYVTPLAGQSPAAACRVVDTRHTDSPRATPNVTVALGPATPDAGARKAKP